jgi:hypothetical protein
MGFAGTAKAIGRTVTLTATDLVTGNTVEAFRVPAGFMTTGIFAVATDMDSGAAMLLNIGDAASASRYFSGLNTQAAITTQTLAATGLLFLNTVDTTIIITIGTQAAGALAGTVALYLSGFMAQ